MRGNVEETGGDVPLSKTLGADATASACGVFPDGNFVSINDINCNPSPRVIIIAKMVRQGGKRLQLPGPRRRARIVRGTLQGKKGVRTKERDDCSQLFSTRFHQRLSFRPWIR